MRQCPNCKSDNPDDARFCNYCGMRLPESKEETLYNDLEGLEKARKVEFSDQEIAEESEKVIDFSTGLQFLYLYFLYSAYSYAVALS